MFMSEKIKDGPKNLTPQRETPSERRKRLNEDPAFKEASAERFLKRNKDPNFIEKRLKNFKDPSYLARLSLAIKKGRGTDVIPDAYRNDYARLRNRVGPERAKEAIKRMIVRGIPPKN